MNAQQRKSDWFLYAVLIFCICSFKIIIIHVGESGIRPDDLLILLAFFVLLFRGDLLATPLSQSIRLYSLFVAVNLASTVWNSATGRVNPLVSAFFDLRLMQYMLFYFLGYALRRAGKNFTGLFAFYCLAMCVVIPLELAGIVPNVSAFDTSRVSGNTNGPYEFAGVAGFLLCYLGYKERKVFYGFASVVFVVLTAARATAVGVAISLFGVLARIARRSVAHATIAAFTGVAFVLFLGGVYVESLANSGGDVMGRISSASSTLSWGAIQAIYATAPVADTSRGYSEGEFLHTCDFGACDASNGDSSTLIRVYRWSTLLKSANAHLSSILIGLGPSFGTEAVDGYYVRLYTETGLAGSLAFIIAMWGFWRTGSGESWPFRQYILILLFTACFIDIFTSYRPMILLWFWHGLNQYELESQTIDA